MAEWSCSGLQLRVRRFDSDSSLHLFFYLRITACSKPCRPDGEIGRRKRLKISRWLHRAGSIPAPGTNITNTLRHPLSCWLRAWSHLVAVLRKSSQICKSCLTNDTAIFTSTDNIDQTVFRLIRLEYRHRTTECPAWKAERRSAQNQGMLGQDARGR